MAYGDTCGKFKLCLTHVGINASGEFLICCDCPDGPLSCSECAETTIGKRGKVTFTGGNTIEWLTGDASSQRALTGTAYGGVMQDLQVKVPGGNNRGGEWDSTDPGDPPVANDHFFPSTIWEFNIDPTFDEWEARICYIRYSVFLCDGNNDSITCNVSLGTYRSDLYVGQGNYSTNYVGPDWNIEPNVSYNIGFADGPIDYQSGSPGGNCDHDYTGTASGGSRWVITGENIIINPTTSWV